MTAARPDVARHIAASAAEVRAALLQVDAALAGLGVAPALRHRAQITLAEACNNIVEHAYGNGATAGDGNGIVLEIVAEADALAVTLRDHGGPMPDGRLPGARMPPLDPADPMGLPEGGFGWPLLRGMAEGLTLTRERGQNLLRFRIVPGDDARISG